MKILIFNLVIAFILEDYGTFQAKPVEQCTPGERVEMFKKHALKLVSAAVRPFQRNEVIMDGGCECLSGVDTNAAVDSFDLILATMSIAKDYENELKVMEESSDISEIVNNEGLMENIRLILVVLQSSPDIFDYVPGRLSWRKYLFKEKRNLPDAASGSSGLDKNVKSAIKCYRSLLSIGFGSNHKFFAKLSAGAKVANEQMRYDDTDPKNDSDIRELQAVLDVIIEKIPKEKLSTPTPAFRKQKVEDLREDLINYWNEE